MDHEVSPFILSFLFLLKKEREIYREREREREKERERKKERERERVGAKDNNTVWQKVIHSLCNPSDPKIISTLIF